MVSEEPAHAVGGATPEARTQDPRALRVLRDYRELAAARTVWRSGGEGLAQVAEPERAAQRHNVGVANAISAQAPPTEADSHALGVARPRNESVI